MPAFTRTAQVANVETERTMDTDAVIRGANALLPDDIRILSVEEVSADFHARRSARSKTYRYQIWRLPIVSPFEFRYVYAFRYPLMKMRWSIVPRAVSLERMISVPSVQRPQRSRTERVRFMKPRGRAPKGNGSFEIRGNGFLQYMVRTIVGTLLEVGQGRILPGTTTGYI